MVKDLRSQLGRKPPALLMLIALIALFFASFYLYQVFQMMPAAIEEDTVIGIFFSIGMMLIMFVMYTNYVMTIFRLSSGSRKAWVGMARLSMTYAALVILSLLDLTKYLPMTVIGEGTILMYVMILVMILMVAYLLTEPVRKFFTPGYADEISMKEWAKYIVGSDPFTGAKMIVTEDLYA